MKAPNAESLILFAFMGCITLWAVSKCSAKRSGLLREGQELLTGDEDEERPKAADTTVAIAPVKPTPVTTTAPVPTAPVPVPEPTQYNSTMKQPSNQAVPLNPPTNTKAKPAANNAKPGTTLYVSIDGLKVRKEPGLKGETLEQLPLYSPVTFLNQKTDWTQEISLGYEKVTDHWVKIRTATGKTGWVFGAGLHYYKMKRPGVLDNKAAAPKKKN